MDAVAGVEDCIINYKYVIGNILLESEFKKNVMVWDVQQEDGNLKVELTVRRGQEELSGMFNLKQEDVSLKVIEDETRKILLSLM